MLIAQITDTHIKPEGSLADSHVDTSAFLARAVDHILHLDPRPDVVLGTGDLVDGGTSAEYARLRHLLSPLPMPVYLIPGNHDDREALRQVFADYPEDAARELHPVPTEGASPRGRRGTGPGDEERRNVARSSRFVLVVRRCQDSFRLRPG